MSTSPTKETVIEVRDFTAFSTWLRDRANGLKREPDYFKRVPEERLLPLFNLLRFNGRKVRRFEFDDNQEVVFRVRANNSFGSSSLLTPAMNAWTAPAPP